MTEDITGGTSRPVERQIVRIIHRLSETERDDVLNRFNSAIWQYIRLTREETKFLESVVSEHGGRDPTFSGRPLTQRAVLVLPRLAEEEQEGVLRILDQEIWNDLIFSTYQDTRWLEGLIESASRQEKTIDD